MLFFYLFRFLLTKIVHKYFGFPKQDTFILTKKATNWI